MALISEFHSLPRFSIHSTKIFTPLTSSSFECCKKENWLIRSENKNKTIYLLCKDAGN
jgi:hypothetical protein